MKIAIISDIHSNILALQTVFDYLKKNNIDKVILLGDVIGIGPHSKECVEFLIDHKDMFLAFIKGNHEKYIINGLPIYSHNDPKYGELNQSELDTFRWNHSFINKEELEFLKTFKISIRLNIEGNSILLNHYPLDENNEFKTFYKNPTLEEIKDIYENDIDNIYLFGHTHNSCYYVDNHKYYINPGSLGCPITTNGASFGILNINKDNKIDYQQINLKYDINKVINEMLTLNYPEVRFLVKTFYKRSND